MRTITGEHLWKSYGGADVLRDVTLTATEAEPVCLMAPSGTGKTTLLRILMGLEQPDRGRVTAPPGCRWAAVFQEDRLLEHLDAMGNLRFALGPALEPERAAALLEELSLGETGTKPVRDYSGGMKRRLALIRALLAPSDALALDEPFTGLDTDGRARCLAAVRRLAAGRIVLLASHNADDARTLDARVETLGGL